MSRLLLSIGVVLVISVGASFAWSLPMALMFSMPLFAGLQRSRLGAYSVALAYYAGASWALMPASRNFFGPSASPLSAVGLWLLSATLLASPFALVWTCRKEHLTWRLPIGTLINAVPPLGIVGWASPLTSSGLLFPGTEWFGLIGTAVLPGLLILRPGTISCISAILILIINLLAGSAPQSPPNWRALDTNFGAVAHESLSPVSEFIVAERIQELARSASDRVVILPEMVVPTWTDATTLFWQQTLDALRSSGKTILLGAGMPLIEAGPGANLPSAPRYRNVVLIAGAQAGVFCQRIPVPFGMWKLFSNDGVPLNLTGKGIVQIGEVRAAVLICYEQLLSWPVLQSMTERPSVLVAIANDYWVVNTPIPRCQTALVKTWARLFRLPVLSATNR